MSSTERFGTFYSPWPVLDGKPLNYQWGEVRSNQAETKAITRNSVQELETGTDELNTLRALLGQAYGDLTFRNRFRLYYNKVTQDFCLQKNTGTVEVPFWVDCWCVRLSDGQFQAVDTGGVFSAAGFYGPGLENIQEVGESGTAADETFHHVSKLFFNVDDGFELNPISSGMNAGSPEVRFTFPFGRAQEFSRSGKEWVIDHNFGYAPVLVQVMDGDKRVVIPDTADVSDPNTAYFYFHGPVSGSVLIATGGVGAVSLIPRDPFYLVVRTNTQQAKGHLMHPNAEVIFDETYFYVGSDLDEEHGGAHQRAFVTLRAESITANFYVHGITRAAGDANINASVTVDTVNVGLKRKLTGMRAFYFTDGSSIFHGASLDIESPSNINIQTGSNAVLTLNTPGASGDVEILSGNVVNISPSGRFNVTAGGDISLKGAGSNDGVLIGKDGMRVNDKVSAEGFYLNSGGNIYSNSDNKLHFETIDASFDTLVLSNYQTLVSDNGPATPALASIYDPNTGLYWTDDDTLGISAGGVYQMLIGRDGVLIKDKMEANAFYIGGGSLNIYQVAHLGFGDDGMVSFDMPVGANFNVNKSSVPGTVDSGTYRTQLIIGRNGIWVEDKINASGFYIKPGANSLGFDLGKASIPIDIPAASVDNYFLDSWAPQGYVIEDVMLATSSGSAEVAFYILSATEVSPRGIGIGGVGNDGNTLANFYVVPSRRTITASSNNVVNADFSLVMSVLSVNSPSHLRGRVKIRLSG